MASKTKKYKSKKEINKKRKNKSKKHFFSKKIKGGNINPPSFETFGNSNQYYYPINNYNNDPSDSNNSISSRNLSNIVGGKKNKKTKKMRKIKGGLDPFLGNGSMNNSLTSFGNVGQSVLGSNLVTGNNLNNNSLISDYPSAHTYNQYNPPLV